MREIEKALLNQIDRARNDLVTLFNATTAAVTVRPPSLAEIRLEALSLAVKARGEGTNTEVIAETAKVFEAYLKGSEGS